MRTKLTLVIALFVLTIFAMPVLACTVEQITMPPTRLAKPDYQQLLTTIGRRPL